MKNLQLLALLSLVAITSFTAQAANGQGADTRRVYHALCAANKADAAAEVQATEFVAEKDSLNIQEAAQEACRKILGDQWSDAQSQAIPLKGEEGETLDAYYTRMGVK